MKIIDRFKKLDRETKIVLLIGVTSIAMNTIRILIGLEPDSDTYDNIYNGIFDDETD